jgi:hypothetical protein
MRWLIEQSVTALTDGMFTVLFSTTPLSASRNYSVKIPSVNAFSVNAFSLEFAAHGIANG